MKAAGLFGIVGWKNSGKTTLVERLVSDITKRGYKVSTVKHAHHSFDIDHKGTDSYRHRMAGASEVLLSSSNRWAIIHELKEEAEPDFDFLVNKLGEVDLILVEGFKYGNHQKLEVIRLENKKSPIFEEEKTIVALATDGIRTDNRLPVFNLNEVSKIADFILKQVGIK